MLPAPQRPDSFAWSWPDLAATRTRAPLWSGFWGPHFWLPAMAFAVLTTLLLGLHGDQWIADRIYALEGHRWSLQAGYWSQDILHAAGRQASKNAWYLVLVVFMASFGSRRWARWRRPLAYLLVATLLSTAMVGLLKRHTNMDCPWDLLRYGGQRAYFGLLAHRPSELARGACFPAGHASAGYAWLALYFFARAAAPRWRWWALGAALALGLVFGIAQQLRGAHFLSHDVWSAMICWLVALGLYRLMLWRRWPRPPIRRAPPLANA